MITQEYKNIIHNKYFSSFLNVNHQHSVIVYENYIDVWLLDISKGDLASIYLPFRFNDFTFKITMCYEDSNQDIKKKIWKTQ